MPEPMKFIFGGEELAVSWARDILKSVGVNPAQELEAIATLRRAEPRLSLRPAQHLVEQLGREPH